MAKGNDGNYLQHCVEVEAAMRLAQTDPRGRLHVALTHGMEPYERLDEPNNLTCRGLLDRALRDAASEPSCNEPAIVTAYRGSWDMQDFHPSVTELRDELLEEKHYPNTATLLHAVIGADSLSGGITEKDEAKYEYLANAWNGSGIRVVRASWRQQLGSGVLACPGNLGTPWLFSMDPMTYTEAGGNEDDDKLHRSDLDLLVPALQQYIGSGQPGMAALFVYDVGSQSPNPQRQFWKFMDDLAAFLRIPTRSYWVAHQGGNRNLAGLLFSDEELVSGFAPPNIKPGRGSRDDRSGRNDTAALRVFSDAIEEENRRAPGAWSAWSAFPDPRHSEYLVAPFGPGVYELRNRATGEMVLFGKGSNVAYRMSSLLPPPLGTGHRSNFDKRKYVLSNLPDIEYRTRACESSEQAGREEKLLREKEHYIFRT